MSEFLSARKDLFSDIQTSHKTLTELKATYDKFMNAIHWLLQEKSSLERRAEKVDSLKNEKDESSENDTVEIGKLEGDLDETMILLSENLKKINGKLAELPDSTEIYKDIVRAFYSTKDKFDKSTCDMVDYKLNRDGKVNVKERYILRKYTVMERSQFACATLKSTKEIPLKIELSSLPREKNDGELFDHFIAKIFEGDEIIFDSGMSTIELIAVNGRYTLELNGEEIKAVIANEIKTGTVVIEVLQPKPKEIAAARVVKFESMENNVSDVTELSMNISTVQSKIENDKQSTIAVENNTESITNEITEKQNVDPNMAVKQSKKVNLEESVTEKEPIGTPEYFEAKIPLAACPPICTISATGGTFTHQLVNYANQRLVFKVKSSNNKEYRIKPVYGFIQPGAAMDLLITRTEGRCSEDKLVIHFGHAPFKSENATEAFKATNTTDTITIPLKAIA